MPDPGTSGAGGSGSGSGSNAGLRRLMRYVGEYSGSGGPSRPVYVGTLCNATGQRKLMRYVGEYPGFWAGSGSGDWVDPRPVYASAECVSRDGEGSRILGGPCCPDLTLPPRLYMKFTRLSGDCTKFDLGTLPLDLDPRAPWIPHWRHYSIPGDYDTGPWFDFVCTDEYPPGGGGTGIFRWRISLEPVFCFFNTNDLRHIAAIVTDESCLLPFCVTAFLALEQQPVTPGQECCDMGTTTVWAITVYEAAAEGVCVPISPGSGGGSGSGSGWERQAPEANRTLMRFAGSTGGRTVYVGTCCPDQSGSGGGGGTVQTDCETDPLPTSLTITFTETVAFCSIDGQSVTLTYTSGQDWVGTFTVDGNTITATLTCTGSGWELTLFSGGVAWWTTGTAGGGSGLPITFTGMTATASNTACPGSVLDATVTA